MCELAYSKATSNPARWVLAVPEDSPVHCAADLAGTIVASELVNTTRRYFAERGVKVKKVRLNQWNGKCAALDAVQSQYERRNAQQAHSSNTDLAACAGHAV